MITIKQCRKLRANEIIRKTDYFLGVNNKSGLLTRVIDGDVGLKPSTIATTPSFRWFFYRKVEKQTKNK